jgi:hypothetical protein
MVGAPDYDPGRLQQSAAPVYKTEPHASADAVQRMRAIFFSSRAENGRSDWICRLRSRPLILLASFQHSLDLVYASGVRVSPSVQTRQAQCTGAARRRLSPVFGVRYEIRPGEGILHMAGVRRLIRWILASVSAVILIPVLGEFFIDFARERGLYEHPSERVKTIIDVFASLGANPVYRLIAVAIVCFALGFWVDYLLGPLMRRDRVDTERNTFTRETIYLPDFLRNGSLLSGKTFDRCLVHGPALIKFETRNNVLFCSVPLPPNRAFVIVPQGSAAMGAIILTDTTFKQCFFDRVTFIGTQQDARTITPGLGQLTLEKWLAKSPLRS